MVDGNVPDHRVTSVTDLGGLNMTKARLNLF
jgi:hypothetical protein